MIEPQEASDALDDAQVMAAAGDVSGASTVVKQLSEDMGRGIGITDKIQAAIRWDGPDHGMTKIIMQEALDEIRRLRATIQQMASVTGLAMEGNPFTEIKKKIRNGK